MAEHTLPADLTDPITARPAPADADLRETVANAIYGQMLPAFLTPTTAYLILTAVMDVLAPVLAARGARVRELEAERAQLRAHLRDAEDYLSLTHTYPATGGGHDILGADFSCAGCALAKKLKEADRG